MLDSYIVSYVDIASLHSVNLHESTFTKIHHLFIALFLNKNKFFAEMQLASICIPISAKTRRKREEEITNSGHGNQLVTSGSIMQ